MKYDKIILGIIYTMNEKMPIANAMGIKDGKISFIGSREEGLARAVTGGHVYDMGDKPIFPGFIDTHVHIVPSGVLMKGCDVSAAKNIKEIQEMLKSYKQTVPTGQWIYAAHFQDKKIEEKRLLTRDELDQVSTEHPVFLYHNDCHPYSFNTMALDILQLDSKADGVLTDDKGRLTGIVVDPACGDIGEKAFALLDDEEYVDAYRRVEDYAVQHGITTIFAKDYFFVLKTILQERESYKTTIKPMLRTPGGCQDHSELDLLLRDPDMMNETTVCTFIDGAFDGWSAANFEPYEGQPENFGMLYNTDEELYSYLKKAHCHNLQVSCHAIGDYGIQQFLNTMERILSEAPRKDHRHRIEHFEMPTPYQIKKMAQLGCACGMQPLLLEVCEGMDMEGYRIFIGDRVKRCSPYRSCLDEGLLVGAGSDFSVTEMKPLHAIRIAMEHPMEDQRISLYEGLKMFTADAARIGFLEDRKGILKPGMDGDFIVLDRNPYAVRTAELSEIKVIMTVSGGVPVWGDWGVFPKGEGGRNNA